MTDSWAWDAKKAEGNWQKHEVRFEAAARVFNDPQAVTSPDPHSDGDRSRTIGAPDPDLPLLLFVVHTGDAERGGRIISARRASRAERKAYETDH